MWTPYAALLAVSERNRAFHAENHQDRRDDSIRGTRDMNALRFTKIEGTGNDFILFDNHNGFFKGDERDFFARICARRTGVGADGILLIQEGDQSPVRMRYYNSDGKIAEMCGNAARCAAYYAYHHNIVDTSEFMIQADDGLHLARVQRDIIEVEMVRPSDFETGLDIVHEAGMEEGGLVDTGVPHLVIFTDHVGEVDVEKTAPKYRFHSRFPDGVNVNFVQRMKQNQLQVRTYERGVEGETLSCGTGCVASALAAHRLSEYRSPVTVHTHGGDLSVRFDPEWSSVALSGPVHVIFDGLLHLTL